MCLWSVGRQAGRHLGPSASCFLAGLIGLMVLAHGALFPSLLCHLGPYAVGDQAILCGRWRLGGQVTYLSLLQSTIDVVSVSVRMSIEESLLCVYVCCMGVRG